MCIFLFHIFRSFSSLSHLQPVNTHWIPFCCRGVSRIRVTISVGGGGGGFVSFGRASPPHRRLLQSMTIGQLTPFISSKIVETTITWECRSRHFFFFFLNHSVVLRAAAVEHPFSFSSSFSLSVWMAERREQNHLMAAG